ncbi:MAG: ABC transporter permease [Saprospiraceae bacterium]|jgi:putative ABC transport system permease protein|nr:ABC transporter permease [Saprospiraceae bacterium]
MTFHYFKSAVRNLWKNRLYSALNLSGLAIGMTAAILIALWVQSELRFDGYHRHAENLWRIKTDLRINDSETWNWGSTPLRISELCAKVPGLSVTAQVMTPYGNHILLRRGPEYFEEENYGYVSANWFETFDYEFAEGDARGFGEHPNALLLTEGLARKIFGNRSALGQTLHLDSAEFTVHAVLRDPCPESSFRHNLLIPTEAWLRQGSNRENDSNWNNFNYTTFVELRHGTDPKKVGAQLTELLREAKQDSNITLHLGALSDLHFDTSLKDDNFDKGSRRTVAVFSFVGLLILLMAAINYMSLTTARAQTRAREAGIRKAVGGSRVQLFAQFLSESAVLAGSASLLALLLVQMSLPWFSELAGRTFVLPWSSPLLWLLAGGVLAATVLLAGVYPAVLLAGFQPVQVLRGLGGAMGRSGARSVFRQSLVVTQFAISVALLICTIVIGRQWSYIQDKEMGYEREHIFSFEIGWQQFAQLGEERSLNMLKTMKQTLSQAPGIAGVCNANGSPVHIESTHSGSVKFDGLPPDAEPAVSQLSADPEYADFFSLKMLEGRWFENGNAADVNNIVLNETAARGLGLHKPWVGQRFGFHGRDGQVIGIVRDFHFLPLHEKIAPLVAFNAPSWRGSFFIKARPGQHAEAIASAEKAWKQWFPERPFRFQFIDEAYNRMYHAEQQASLLFSLFAGIAIFIAGLGLFGLATFVALQRTKEIGIRKVLGASVAGIATLLAADFLKLVLVAVVLAVPPAYFFMQRWLEDFAYRIELQWWMFALAGLVATVIALATVGAQSAKAALADPIKSLRSE